MERNKKDGMLNSREFNIRVSFDEDGKPTLGFVQSFFAVDSNCVDIKQVDYKTQVEIAKALGITQSSKSFAVNRVLRDVNIAMDCALCVDVGDNDNSMDVVEKMEFVVDH